MISKRDLEDAIAECQGQHNPNANTCIKLAAYYTIRQHLYPEQEEYSYSGPSVIETDGDSEFAKAVNGMETRKVLQIIEEGMDVISVLQPRLYKSIIRRLADS